MLMKKAKLTFSVCLILLLTFSPSGAVDVVDFDVISRYLKRIGELYDAGQYKKAREQLDLTRKTMGMDDAAEDYGMAYPEVFRSSIKHYESLMNDREGVYKALPQFTGVVVEWNGNTAGYFVVKGIKGEKDFLYDARLIVKDGSFPEIDSEVTVYYEGGDASPDDLRFAMKIVGHR